MLIENTNIEDLLEYLNPMSKSELDNLLSDTPKSFKDCISYFSDKIIAEDVKAKDVKDFLSERVSNSYLETKLWNEIEKNIYPYISTNYLKTLTNSKLEDAFIYLENKAILEVGSEYENSILVDNLNIGTKKRLIQTVDAIYMINDMIIINRFSKKKFIEVAKKVFGFKCDESEVIWYCCDKMRNELERFYLLKAISNLNKISSTIDAMYDIVDDIS
jgi:hypothetical protein